MRASALFVLIATAFYSGVASFKPKRAVIARRAGCTAVFEEPSALRGGGGGGADAAAKLEKRQIPKGQYSLGKALEIHKGMWLPVSLAFNYYYDNFSHRSCLMAALFGGYGINWILKSHTFFDKNFYNKDEFIGGISSVLLNWAMLSIFFFFPYLAARNTDPISPAELLASVLLYSLGTFLHYGADAQKHYTLKFRGPGLIADGFFAKLQSPSYFGENLIFGAYAIIAGFGSRLVWVPLSYLLLGLTALGNNKSKSLARYEGYEDWKKKTLF